jgi:hypothetical protein
MSAVKRFCHRAALLDRGEVVRIGEPNEVAAEYVNRSFAASGDGLVDEEVEGVGDGTAELVEAWWEDEHGQRQSVLHQGQPCSFHARAVFHEAVEQPALATVFENERHQPLMATSSDEGDTTSGVFRAGDEVEFSVSFDMVFAPGRVYASPWVAHRGQRIMDQRPRMTSVVVAGAHVSGGLVDLPHDVKLQAGSRILQGQGEA